MIGIPDIKPTLLTNFKCILLLTTGSMLYTDLKSLFILLYAYSLGIFPNFPLPLALVTTIPVFAFINLTILDTLYRWNHTVLVCV